MSNTYNQLILQLKEARYNIIGVRTTRPYDLFQGNDLEDDVMFIADQAPINLILSC